MGSGASRSTVCLDVIAGGDVFFVALYMMTCSIVRHAFEQGFPLTF